MVNIVTNGQPASITLNVDTGETHSPYPVQDSIVNLAENTGIVDAINTMNQEGYQEDHDLRMNYEMQNQNTNDQLDEDDYHQNDNSELYDNEPSQPKKKKPKKKGDSVQKRFDEITYKLIEERREKEELERQLKRSRDENAAFMLSVERDRIAHDINRVTDVMIKAKDNDQTQTYVKANRLMHELVTKESETNNALTHLQNSYQDEHVEPEHEQHAEQRFIGLSDPRELKSDSYTDWLRENPYYNPYDAENYDEDLANDIHEVKRNFNKFLKKNRNADFIGTSEYYQEIDALVDMKFSQFQPQQRYSNQGYNQYQQEESEPMAEYRIPINQEYEQSLGQGVPEGQSRYQSGIYPDDNRYQQQQQRAPQQRGGPAPVNRSGYNQQYQNNQLPQLTAQELQMAKVIPMYNTRSERLTESEAIHQYRVEKMNMMSKNRR